VVVVNSLERWAWRLVHASCQAMGLPTVLKSGIGKLSTNLLPVSNTYKSETRKENGNALYDVDFAANAASLYKFIYEK